MKTFFTLLAFVLSMNEALAKGLPLPKPEPRQYGQQCGLVDGFDDTFEDIGETLTIENGTTFTNLEIRQIVKAAQILSAPWDQDRPDAALKASIDWLTEASEGGEVYLKHAQKDGAKYSYLIFYPGGNPYGVIFKQGTLKDVAHIQDSDIVCTKSFTK